MKKDYSISLIRLISTIFIVSCHMMQYLKFPLAWVFNVGVQIFLFMSGYLYGLKKYDGDDINFYKKQFKKILIDYYIVIIPVIIIYFVFSRNNISKTIAYEMLLTHTTVKGGGHLWYIAYCLICYLITPFLYRLFDDILKKKHIVIHTSIIMLLIITIINNFFKYFNSAWIFCYIFGFFIGNLKKENLFKLEKNISIISIIIALIMNSIRILEYFKINIVVNRLSTTTYERFCNFSHVLLGVSLFIIFRLIFNTIFKKEYPNIIKKICSYTDKMSYDIYLVHQFLILGPFTLMRLTPYLIINIIIILILIIILATIVNFLSNRTKKIIEKIEC